MRGTHTHASRRGDPKMRVRATKVSFLGTLPFFGHQVSGDPKDTLVSRDHLDKKVTCPRLCCSSVDNIPSVLPAEREQVAPLAPTVLKTLMGSRIKRRGFGLPQPVRRQSWETFPRHPHLATVDGSLGLLGKCW